MLSVSLLDSFVFVVVVFVVVVDEDTSCNHCFGISFGCNKRAVNSKLDQVTPGFALIRGMRIVFLDGSY